VTTAAVIHYITAMKSCINVWRSKKTLPTQSFWAVYLICCSCFYLKPTTHCLFLWNIDPSLNIKPSGIYFSYQIWWLLKWLCGVCVQTLFEITVCLICAVVFVIYSKTASGSRGLQCVSGTYGNPLETSSMLRHSRTHTLAHTHTHARTHTYTRLKSAIH